jgi:DnaK suppressor protein
MAAKIRKKTAAAKPTAAKSTTAKPTAKPKAKAKTKAKAIVKPKAEVSPKPPARPKPKSRVVDSPFKNFIPTSRSAAKRTWIPSSSTIFRDILLKWRQDLMEEVDRTVHHMQDEAANFPDPADRATQEEEFSIELRTA